MLYNRKGIIAGVAVLIICGFCLNLFFSEGRRGEENVPEGGESPRLGPPPKAEVSPAQSGQASAASAAVHQLPISYEAPLPNATEPFAAQLPALLVRSEGGDPVASCRLIVSINRCKEEERSRRVTDSMIRSLAARTTGGNQGLIDIVAREKEARAKSGAFCSGVALEALPDLDGIFERSVGLLTPHQKTIIAMTRSNGTLRRVNGRFSFSESGLYVLPQFLADHTVEFLMAGYEARDPLALEGLVLLHAPGNALAPTGVGLWHPNPRLFMQYSLLMHEIYGPEALGNTALQLMQVTAASLGPDEMRRITLSVQTEASSWKTFGKKYYSTKDGKADGGIEGGDDVCAK